MSTQIAATLSACFCPLGSFPLAGRTPWVGGDRWGILVCVLHTGARGGSKRPRGKLPTGQ